MKLLLYFVLLFWNCPHLERSRERVSNEKKKEGKTLLNFKILVKLFCANTQMLTFQYTQDNTGLNFDTNLQL
jgi:hypothetical protein